MHNVLQPISLAWPVAAFNLNYCAHFYTIRFTYMIYIDMKRWDKNNGLPILFFTLVYTVFRNNMITSGSENNEFLSRASYEKKLRLCLEVISQ